MKKYLIMLLDSDTGQWQQYDNNITLIARISITGDHGDS